MDKVAEFERIEAVVNDAATFRTLKAKEVEALRDSLRANTPLSHNTGFVERVRRVELSLSDRLNQKHWWERPLGIVFLAVLAGVIIAAIVCWLGLA